ncbi:MAG: carboxypeptidase-like regulatory domain-containing protein [Candidatus Bathyarchaeia archaeon]
MSKRILATLCVTIFIISVLASVSQVSAHYTLGDQLPGSIGEQNAGGLPWTNGKKQYHTPPDWQGHVPGHIAYVLPGSLYVPPSDQVNYYSPNGSVIVDTVGDLRFYICLADDLGDGQSGPINISWRANTVAGRPPALGDIAADPPDLSRYLYIAIPPEFTPPVDWTRGSPDLLTLNRGDGVRSNVETSITNDYNMIYTGKFQPNHPVAPGWWFVRITSTPIEFPQDQVDNVKKLNGAFDDKYVNNPNYKGSSGFLYPPNMDPWLDRQMRTGPFAGCYQIKINNMKAPSIAGKYFFKIFYTSTKQPYNSTALEGLLPVWQQQGKDPLSGYANNYFEKYDTFWPENYPVLLVKGEVDPGYITGTVRYCGHSSYYYGYYYGSGVHTSGKVVAEGTAIDPVTNQPLNRKVTAWGFFLGELPGQEEDLKDRDKGSEGRYEIEGLAPGIYTLTAYAAGFVPRTLATQITVKAGQSIHGVDIYVCPAPKLQTKVYSKCPTGPVDWPEYVTLDDLGDLSEVILPVVPGGADVRGTSTTAPDGLWYWFTEGAQTVKMKSIWADLMSDGTKDFPGDYDTDGEIAALKNKYGWAWQELVDANGTVVAWQDFTFDITATGDKRAFGTFWGDPSCYSGIETGWDGHVPTFLADFTSGILPGTYRVRTWVFGYVQTREYTVTFPAVEFSGSAYIEMDLFKGGTIATTIHFHNQEMPSKTDPASGWLLVEAVDANGVVQAWTSSSVKDESEKTLTLRGESNAWRYFGRIHGMPEGTYTIKAYLQHYVQQEFPQHTIQYCTSGSMSFHMIKGAMIKTTVYSRDCQDPSQPVNWVHAGEAIAVDVITSAGTVFGSRGRTYQDPTTDKTSLTVGGGGSNIKAYLRRGLKPSGLTTDVYRLKAYTPGYVQLQVPEVWAQKGSSTGDIPIYLLVGPEIRVVVDFKIELIPKPLPPEYYSYYFRISAFDENGTLRAANITAVPQATWANYAQSPWLGDLNPAQPDGVQTWVFQLFGFSPFTTPTNTPAWGLYNPTMSPYGAKFGQIDPYYIEGYHDGTNFYKNYGIMWGKTYTIVVAVQWAGYTQLATVTATPTCKGVTTVIFEMDRMGKIAGFVWTRNWMGDFRAASWLEQTAAGAKVSKKAYSFDGSYSVFVTPDTYKITSALVPPGKDAGYKSASRTAVATWGGVTGGQDFYLEESGIPIPEFPAAGIMALISALAASLYLLKWRRKTTLPVR